MFGAVIVVGVAGVVLQVIAGASEKLVNEDPATINTGSLQSAFNRVFDASLDLYTPVSPVLGDSRCRTHGLLLRQAVKEGHLWALHMVDASSKLPSGLLTGNLIQPGNVDQCLAVSHVDPEHGPITGQHCLVSLGPKNAMTALVFFEKLAAGQFRGTGLDVVESLLSQRRFKDAVAQVGATWSLCIPASCTPGDLQRHLRATLPGHVQVSINDLACVDKQRLDSQPLSIEFHILCVVFTCICGAVMIGTIYDLSVDAASPRNQYIVALSLYTNGKSLLKINTSTDTLASFEGLRCTTILWTILVHHFLLSMTGPNVNYRKLEDVSNSWMHVLISNGTLSVDIMFVISGALLAFNFLRDRERNVKFSLWRFYLNRYIRLTPTLAVALMVASTPFVASYLTPSFIVETAHIVKSCKKYGWMIPLYVSNYFDSDHLCLIHVWSTQVDIQLFWISPLLLIPLWRAPRVGGMLLLALGVAGIGTVFSMAYRMQLKPLNIMLPDLVDEMYAKAHLRATPWLIGLGLGYLLHKTKGRKDVLSGIQTVLGWTASLLLTSYALLSAPAYYQHGGQLNPVDTALYVALMRPTWALGIAWLIFACERGRGGVLNTFLAWPVWQVPARLCYAMSFTNLAFIAGLMFFKKTPQHYDAFETMIGFFGMATASLLSGVIVYLMIESPSSQLYRLLMRKESTTQKKDS